VGATLITFVGIVASLYVSVRAIREVTRDRELRHKPYLAFEPGAESLPIEFVRQGRAVPGVDRAYAERALSNIPGDAESAWM
jgi:hypothetical protein